MFVLLVLLVLLVFVCLYFYLGFVRLFGRGGYFFNFFCGGFASFCAAI